MTEALAASILFTILSLLALLVLSAKRANERASQLRQYVTTILAIQTVLTLVMTAVITISGEASSSLTLGAAASVAAGLGLYIDGVSILMLTMVSVIGFVVSRFSIRYLQGEATQGRYFRWLGFTLGAVSMMVVAGNLLQFFAAWVMTSLGLHQLLLHYRHRPAAHRAAWTKFAISRIGDVFLIAALILTFQSFGTFEIRVLLQRAQELIGGSQATVLQHAIGWLIVCGAVTKSAQFPFHTWLPNTMETPTPVSALMHAGIVNAGGFLIVRTSPMVALAPEALATLAVIGAFTACFAGVVMMTQPSIKRALAYSTVAQMGFMMLQCGLGAFSAAMLHILAHSFYKAHAFLTSGSVIARTAGTSAGSAEPKPASRHGLPLALAALLPIIALGGLSYGLNYNLAEKSGGLVLAFLLCLALTTWGWRLLQRPEQVSVATAIAGVFGLCLAYVACFLCVDFVVASAIAEVPGSAVTQFIMFDICLAFAALFFLHVLVARGKTPGWTETWRVHASNGFYIDALYQRWFGAFAKP